MPKRHDASLSAGESLGAPFGHKPSLVLLLFYCWSFHTSLKNNVSIVKTKFWQIAHITNFWQIMIWQITQFFFCAICWKFHSAFFSAETFSANRTDPEKALQYVFGKKWDQSFWKNSILCRNQTQVLMTSMKYNLDIFYDLSIGCLLKPQFKNLNYLPRAWILKEFFILAFFSQVFAESLLKEEVDKKNPSLMRTHFQTPVSTFHLYLSTSLLLQKISKRKMKKSWNNFTMKRCTQECRF